MEQTRRLPVVALRGVDGIAYVRSADYQKALAYISELEAIADAAQEVIDQDVKVSRPDGGENRLGISLANLKCALEAL